MSNMIRCPVICSIHVWTYSSDERRDEDEEERDGNAIDARPGRRVAM